MKIIYVTLVAATSFALGACSSNEQRQTANNSGSPTVAVSPPIKPNPPAAEAGLRAPFDLQFIDNMTAHHQGALDMAREVEQKATRPELKRMSQDIIRDQTREIEQMKGWRDQWYPGAPTAQSDEIPGMHDIAMTGAGAAFDLAFLDAMTMHHNGAVQMAREALQRAEHPEIKSLAQAIIDAQEREIVQMNKWKAAWSGAGK